MTRPFDPHREVRVGLVLYGGVSLAVYMSGVVQELLHLVRASAPSKAMAEGPSALLLDEQASGDDDDGLRSTEAVYRCLACLSGAQDDDLSGSLPGPDDPVRTRFVVDIISGSSAGGINGIFLAKALANEQSLDQLEDLWVQQGDIAALLNDRQGSKDVGGTPKRKAQSLLSGHRMFVKLREAFDGMDEPKAGPAAPAAAGAGSSRLVDELDLWVTTTDLFGVDLPIRLADRTITEPRHRFAFHFVFGERQVLHGSRNDFTAGVNPLLAFAGRATSSYPFAFEPAMLSDELGEPPDPPATDPWATYFRPYRRVGADYWSRPFGDGGDMDNKPFSYVLDTLAKRRSTVPVDRKLLYVEPDPAPAAPAQAEMDRPDAVASVIKAVMLGRAETIREDLLRVEARNRVVADVASATDLVDQSYRAGFASPSEQTVVGDWLKESATQTLARGPGYAGWLRLRYDRLLTEFARSITGLTWMDEPTAAGDALEALVRHWVAIRYSDDPLAPRAKWFLRDFDISFRVRRLAFVAARADELHHLGPAALQTVRDAKMTRPPPTDEQGRASWRSAALAAKWEINRALAQLASWQPALAAAPDEAVLDAELAKLGMTRDDLATGSPDELAAWAKARLASPDALLRFDEYGTGIAALLRQQFHETARIAMPGVPTEDLGSLVESLPGPTPDADGRDALTDSPDALVVRSVLQSFFDRYADFDLVLYPILTTAGGVGEIDPMEVVRISPDDAPSLVDTSTGKEKLAGTSVFHFGGFLDEDWRRNDIMWGRLDAAERIVTTFTPPGPLRDKLIGHAHERILREAGALDGGPAAGGPGRADGPLVDDPVTDRERAAALRAFSTSFEQPTELDDAAMVKVAARAAAVVSDILGELDDRPGASWVRRPLVWIARVLWGVAEILVPRSLGDLLLSHWLRLATLVGAVLVLLGGVFGGVGVSRTGWLLLLGAFAAYAGRALLRAVEDGTWKARGIAVGLVLGVVLLTLAVVGAFHTVDVSRGWACEHLPDAVTDAASVTCR